MCLLAVLGSQGIVVKCVAAIFFCTVDSESNLVGNFEIGRARIGRPI